MPRISQSNWSIHAIQFSHISEVVNSCTKHQLHYNLHLHPFSPKPHTLPIQIPRPRYAIAMPHLLPAKTCVYVQEIQQTTNNNKSQRTMWYITLSKRNKRRHSNIHNKEPRSTNETSFISQVKKLDNRKDEKKTTMHRPYYQPCLFSIIHSMQSTRRIPDKLSPSPTSHSRL